MKRVLLFTFLLITVCIHADVRYVSKTGSSTPPYLTWETAADSIQKCINICNSGDTVYVGSGTYKEKIIMKAGISLIGNGMDSCIIDTREFPQDPQIMAVTVDDNFLFSGFSVYVSPPTGKQGYGIWSVCPVPFSQYRGTIVNNKFVGGGIAVVSQDIAH